MDKPSPSALWNQANQYAKNQNLAHPSLTEALRKARYNELMIEHGHVIVKD